MYTQFCKSPDAHVCHCQMVHSLTEDVCGPRTSSVSHVAPALEGQLTVMNDESASPPP